MNASRILSFWLSSAPPAPCTEHKKGDWIKCDDSGAARNSFVFRSSVDAVSLRTDGDRFRFPPDVSSPVCDWCVFDPGTKRSAFVELKGSDYKRALAQLRSTMGYMGNLYGLLPCSAVIVISGAHPRNASPGKAQAKARFKKDFGIPPKEANPGKYNGKDIL